MKYLFLLLITSIQIYAQNPLQFDKKNTQCEDKWVAFPMDKDNNYGFGFLYIDADAGLTLYSGGSFKIDSKGAFIPSEKDLTNRIIARLQPNNNPLAIIPDSKLKELKVDKVPDWLESYKEGENTIERLYKWGFLYNAWGQCEKALTYLEKAKTINPKFKGLAMELAYAYNALGNFEKSVPILEGAIKNSPKDCPLYKELVYAEIHLKQFDKAAKTIKQGNKICTDSDIKAEMAFNMAGAYFQMKDKANFELWAVEVRKEKNANAQFSNYIDAMTKELNK